MLRHQNKLGLVVPGLLLALASAGCGDQPPAEEERVSASLSITCDQTLTLSSAIPYSSQQVKIVVPARDDEAFPGIAGFEETDRAYFSETDRKRPMMTFRITGALAANVVVNGKRQGSGSVDGQGLTVDLVPDFPAEVSAREVDYQLQVTQNGSSKVHVTCGLAPYVIAGVPGHRGPQNMEPPGIVSVWRDSGKPEQATHAAYLFEESLLEGDRGSKLKVGLVNMTTSAIWVNPCRPYHLERWSPKLGWIYAWSDSPSASASCDLQEIPPQIVPDIYAETGSRYKAFQLRTDRLPTPPIELQWVRNQAEALKRTFKGQVLKELVDDGNGGRVLADRVFSKRPTRFGVYRVVMTYFEKVEAGAPQGMHRVPSLPVFIHPRARECYQQHQEYDEITGYRDGAAPDINLVGLSECTASELGNSPLAYFQAQPISPYCPLEWRPVRFLPPSATSWAGSSTVVNGKSLFSGLKQSSRDLEDLEQEMASPESDWNKKEEAWCDGHPDEKECKAAIKRWNEAIFQGCEEVLPCSFIPAIGATPPPSNAPENVVCDEYNSLAWSE